MTPKDNRSWVTRMVIGILVSLLLMGGGSYFALANLLSTKINKGDVDVSIEKSETNLKAWILVKEDAQNVLLNQMMERLEKIQEQSVNDRITQAKIAVKLEEIVKKLDSEIK